MNLEDNSIKSPSEYLFSPHKRLKPLTDVDVRIEHFISNLGIK